MLKRLLISCARILTSLIFAGILYATWMTIAIPTVKSGCGPIIKLLIWILAPIFTAAGYTTGIVLFDLLVCKKKSKLFDIYKLLFISCAVGAIVVVHFGPMLIVFGMFGFGTLCVILRETTLLKNKLDLLR